MTKKLLLILLLCTPAFCQRYDNFSFTADSSNNMSVVPFAQIPICNHPANAVPCTNYATTYTDSSLVTACTPPNQLQNNGTSGCTNTSDAQGNWGVFSQSGQYDYTITVGNNSFGPYTFIIPPNPNSQNLWSRLQTYIGGIASSSTNGIVNVSSCINSSSSPSWCNGAVISSQSPGSGYSGNWSCSVTGGVIVSGGSAAVCKAAVDTGGLYFLITDPGQYSTPPTGITFSSGTHTGLSFASVTLDSSSPRTLSQWVMAAVSYLYKQTGTGSGVISIDPTASSANPMNVTAIIPHGISILCNGANIDWRGSWGSVSNGIVNPALVFLAATSPIYPDGSAGNSNLTIIDGCNFTNHGNTSYVDYAYDKNAGTSTSAPNYVAEVGFGGDPNGLLSPSTYTGSRIILSHTQGGGFNAEMIPGNTAFNNVLLDNFPQLNLNQIGIGTLWPCGTTAGENLRVISGTVANGIGPSMNNNCTQEVNLISASLDYSDHWGWSSANSTATGGKPTAYTETYTGVEIDASNSRVTVMGGHLEHYSGPFWTGKNASQLTLLGGDIFLTENGGQLGIAACDIVDATHILVIQSQNSFGPFPTSAGGQQFQIAGSTNCPSLNTTAGSSVVQFTSTSSLKVVTNSIVAATTTSTLTPSTTHFASITSCSVTSGVATITAANTFTGGGGQSVFLAGIVTNDVTGYCANFNNTTVTTASATGSAFTFVTTQADFATEAQASGYAGLVDTGGTYIQNATQPSSCAVAGVNNLIAPMAITSFSIDGTNSLVTLNGTNSFVIGQVITPTGLLVGTYLNGVHLLVKTATTSSITAVFSHATVGSTADTGTVNGTSYLATIPVVNSYDYGGQVTPFGMTTCAALNGQSLILGRNLFMNGSYSSNASGGFNGTGTGSANTLVSDVTAFLAPVKVNSVSLTTNVITVKGGNTYAAGVTGTLSGIVGSGSDLNGTTLTVLSSGLSTTAFTANATHADFASALQSNAVFTPTLPSGLETVGVLQTATESGLFKPTTIASSVIISEGTRYSTPHPVTSICDTSASAASICDVREESNRSYNVPTNSSALNTAGPVTLNSNTTASASPLRVLCPTLTSTGTCGFRVGLDFGTNNFRWRYHPATPHYADLTVDGDEKLRVDANALTDGFWADSTGLKVTLAAGNSTKLVGEDSTNHLNSMTIGSGLALSAGTLNTAIVYNYDTCTAAVCAGLSANQSIRTMVASVPGSHGAQYLLRGELNQASLGTSCAASSVALQITYTDLDTGVAVARTVPVQIWGANTQVATLTAATGGSLVSSRFIVSIVAQSGTAITWNTTSYTATSCSPNWTYTVRPLLILEYQMQ